MTSGLTMEVKDIEAHVITRHGRIPADEFARVPVAGVHRVVISGSIDGRAFKIEREIDVQPRAEGGS